MQEFLEKCLPGSPDAINVGEDQQIGEKEMDPKRIRCLLEANCRRQFNERTLSQILQTKQAISRSETHITHVEEIDKLIKNINPAISQMKEILTYLVSWKLSQRILK